MEETSILDGQLPLGESDHDKEAIAISEGKKPEVAKEGLLAGKYKSVADLEKSYLELQKKLGSKTSRFSETTTDIESVDSSNDDSSNTESDNKSDSDDVDNDNSNVSEETFQKYSDEFYESGTLSEDSYNELQKMGIPKSYVDQYIEGVKLLNEQKQNDVLSVVGGKESYEKMVQWASSNYSQEDIDSFNEAVRSGKESTVKIAIKALQNDFTKAHNDNKPHLVKGTGKTNVTANGYTSKAAMLADIQSKEYKNDPKFRSMVETKLKYTNM